MNAQAQDKAAGDFFAAPTLLIFPRTTGDFEVFLKQAGRYVLYTRGQDGFTEGHRKKLFDNGIEEIYIQSERREAFEDYLEQNLGKVLLDETLPIRVRSQVFYNVSLGIMEGVFDSKLIKGLPLRNYERIQGLVRNSSAFLTKSETLSNLSRLIEHDYKTFSHCLHVMIYATALLDACGLGDQALHDCGVGAILHDIGKVRIPRSVLNKRARLDQQEWHLIQRHPALGVAICAHLPISRDAQHCIMFHHEKADGGGYPTGVDGGDIPLMAKAVCIADVYDALTSERPYARAVSPFEALRIMRDEMEGSFDPELFKKFMAVLSQAGLLSRSQ